LAVDHRFVLDEAKGPGLGIPQLSPRGNRANLSEAKSEVSPDRNGTRLLIETGRKTNWVGKPKPPNLLGEAFVIEPEERSDCPTSKRGPRKASEGTYREGMGVFRLQAKKDRP
jgi:hypothetical protein